MTLRLYCKPLFTDEAKHLQLEYKRRRLFLGARASCPRPQDARALREAARGEFESVKPGLEVLKRLEFLRRLNEVPGFDMSETAIDKHPTLRLTDLGTADALAKFLEALDWLVEEVKAP